MDLCTLKGCSQLHTTQWQKTVNNHRVCSTFKCTVDNTYYAVSFFKDSALRKAHRQNPFTCICLVLGEEATKMRTSIILLISHYPSLHLHLE